MAVLLNPFVMIVLVLGGSALAGRWFLAGSISGLLGALVTAAAVVFIGLPLLFIGTVMKLHAWGKYRMALGLLRSFEKFPLVGTMARDFRGHMLFSLGRFEEAESALRATLAAAKEQQPVERAVDLDSLGELLVEMRKWDEAETILREAIELAPNRGGSYSSLARVVLERDGDAAQSLAILEQALDGERRDPHAQARTQMGNDLRVEIYCTRAEALLKLGQALEAEQTMERALKLEPGKSKPDIAETAFKAGAFYEKLGRADEARRHYQKAAKIDPEHYLAGEARQALDRLAA